MGEKCPFRGGFDRAAEMPYPLAGGGPIKPAERLLRTRFVSARSPSQRSVKRFGSSFRLRRVNERADGLLSWSLDGRGGRPESFDGGWSAPWVPVAHTEAGKNWGA